MLKYLLNYTQFMVTLNFGANYHKCFLQLQSSFNIRHTCVKIVKGIKNIAPCRYKTFNL
jgi:hypothetical protein